MDQIDRVILNLLQQNAKVTNAELAETAGLSPAGTLERVRKLEKRGFLKGYVALVDGEKVGRGTRALVQLSLAHHNRPKIEAFREAVLAMPEVMACFHITGEYDFLLHVAVADIASFESFVLNRLTTLAEIGRIHTNFILSVVKDQTQFIIDEDDTARKK